MAQHTIIHTCGHESVIVDNDLPMDTWGIRDPKLIKIAKERKLKNARESICPACAEEVMADEIAASGTDLIGSPKQVVWAKEIEKEFWVEFARKCDGFKGRIEQAISAGKIAEPTRCRALVEKHTKAVTAELLDKRQASWWIDNRNGLAEKMAMTVGKRVQTELGVK